MYSNYNDLYTSSLYHSGIKGMKWGVRRKAKKKMQKSTLKLNLFMAKALELVEN